MRILMAGNMHYPSTINMTSAGLSVANRINPMTNPFNARVGRIFYIIPDIHRSDYRPRQLARAIKKGRGLAHIKKFWFRKPKPVGGIKVMYQHCMLLQELGYDAWPLRMGRYEGNFFGYPLQCKTIQEVGFGLRANDVVLCPEITPYLGLQFGAAKKVMFAQNWTHMYGMLKKQDSDLGYTALGFDSVMVCGSYLQSRLDRDPAERVHLVSNFIDHEKFRPDTGRRIPGRILALPRKNPDDLTAIMHALHDRRPDFRLVDGVSQAQMIDEFQQADIFLATGYPEGFGLPPLEAMACGAAVAGFTGGGANEFMQHQVSAMVAADGDVQSAADHIINLLDNPTLKETLRQNGLKTAQRYDRKQTQQQLASFFQSMEID